MEHLKFFLCLFGAFLALLVIAAVLAMGLISFVAWEYIPYRPDDLLTILRGFVAISFVLAGFVTLVSWREIH